MKAKSTKVFLSYARKDEPVAHLLASILRHRKIECLIDRDLHAGTKFDTTIQSMIRSADVVLVLLTPSSLSSAWVNQEVGFAVAKGKVVLPLAMTEDIQPEGMLITTQSYSLFDWNNPSGTIDKLIATLRDAAHRGANDGYEKTAELDQVITGKVERTRFIIEWLGELAKSRAPVTLYTQAAFSTFAFSRGRMYKEAGNHSDEYMDVLARERRLFQRLIDRRKTDFRMILWPVRAYDKKYLAVRFENLLKWMRDAKTPRYSHVKYVCARYIGPNRLIIPGAFCLEGYKQHHTSGYEMSVVRYERAKVEEAVKDFLTVWEPEHRSQTKAKAIQCVRTKYQQIGLA